MKRVFGDGEDYDEFKTTKKVVPLAATTAQKVGPQAPGPQTSAATQLLASPPLMPPLMPAPLMTSRPAALPQQPKALPQQTQQPQQPRPAPQRQANFLQDSERDNSFADIDLWLRKPGLPSSQKPLLVIGPTGSGKSAIIEYYAACANICIETYDFDFDLHDFLQSSGLRQKGPGIIAIEDLDASQKHVVKKSIGLKNIRRLVVTTCDEFSTSTLAWTKICTTVRLERPKKFFMAQVIQAKWPSIDSEARSMLIEASGGNLAVALQSASLGLTCIADMPMDVPKATRCMLMGQTVKCLGGLSDTSYLSQLIEQNLPQCFGPKRIDHLARQLDHLSLLDICATTKEFEGEHLWTTLQSIAKTSQPASKFMFEWLKSTKPLVKPKMDYVHGTCAHVDLSVA